jgi:hypothetical protein
MEKETAAKHLPKKPRRAPSDDDFPVHFEDSEEKCWTVTGTGVRIAERDIGHRQIAIRMWGNACDNWA